MNRRTLITKMVSGFLGTLVLPARLRKLVFPPKPILEVELHPISTAVGADIEALKRKLAIALRIPMEYLKPPTAEERHKLQTRFLEASNEIHRHRVGSPPKILHMDDATEQILVDHKDSLLREKK